MQLPWRSEWAQQYQTVQLEVHVATVMRELQAADPTANLYLPASQDVQALPSGPASPALHRHHPASHCLPVTLCWQGSR